MEKWGKRKKLLAMSLLRRSSSSWNKRVASLRRRFWGKGETEKRKGEKIESTFPSSLLRLVASKNVGKLTKIYLSKNDK